MKFSATILRADAEEKLNCKPVSLARQIGPVSRVLHVGHVVVVVVAETKLSMNLRALCIRRSFGRHHRHGFMDVSGQVADERSVALRRA